MTELAQASASSLTFAQIGTPELGHGFIGTLKVLVSVSSVEDSVLGKLESS